MLPLGTPLCSIAIIQASNSLCCEFSIQSHLQILHQDLTITSEERILDAILLWGMQTNEQCSWELVDSLEKFCCTWG